MLGTVHACNRLLAVFAQCMQALQDIQTLDIQKGRFILWSLNTSQKIRLIAESKTSEGLEKLVAYAKDEFERTYDEAKGSR